MQWSPTMDEHLGSRTLDQEGLIEGVAYLSKRDADLAQVVKGLGPPPLWARQPGFPTLVHIILEQQVSLASARAAFDKLNQVASPLTPERFLELTDRELKQVGFSWQKREYCRGLSRSILAGDLDLDRLGDMTDTAARAELVKVKGIGPWTANIYLLMALLRPDVWPSGDLAIAKAVQTVKGLASLPSTARLDEIAQPWKPWRAVAARILWYRYLN
jgi:DNA-3-methyladenine glycosylase II